MDAFSDWFTVRDQRKCKRTDFVLTGAQKSERFSFQCCTSLQGTTIESITSIPVRSPQEQSRHVLYRAILR